MRFERNPARLDRYSIHSYTFKLWLEDFVEGKDSASLYVDRRQRSTLREEYILNSIYPSDESLEDNEARISRLHEVELGASIYATLEIGGSVTVNQEASDGPCLVQFSPLPDSEMPTDLQTLQTVLQTIMPSSQEKKETLHHATKGVLEQGKSLTIKPKSLTRRLLNKVGL